MARFGKVPSETEAGQRRFEVALGRRLGGTTENAIKYEDKAGTPTVAADVAAQTPHFVNHYSGVSGAWLPRLMHRRDPARTKIRGKNL